MPPSSFFLPSHTPGKSSHPIKPASPAVPTAPARPLHQHCAYRHGTGEVHCCPTLRTPVYGLGRLRRLDQASSPMYCMRRQSITISLIQAHRCSSSSDHVESCIDRRVSYRVQHANHSKHDTVTMSRFQYPTPELRAIALAHLARTGDLPSLRSIRPPPIVPTVTLPPQVRHHVTWKAEYERVKKLPKLPPPTDPRKLQEREQYRREVRDVARRHKRRQDRKAGLPVDDSTLVSRPMALDADVTVR